MNRRTDIVVPFTDLPVFGGFTVNARQWTWDIHAAGTATIRILDGGAWEVVDIAVRARRQSDAGPAVEEMFLPHSSPLFKAVRDEIEDGPFAEQVNTAVRAHRAEMLRLARAA